MNYKLILLFLFSLLTDYFVFFPLSGTKETLIVPVLLVAIAVTADYNSMLLAGFLFSGAAELIGGFNTGTLILPFLGVALIYFGMDKFLSLKSAQYSFQDGILRLVPETLLVAGLVYIFQTLSFMAARFIHGEGLEYARSLHFYNYKILIIVLIQTFIVVGLLKYTRSKPKYGIYA